MNQVDFIRIGLLVLIDFILGKMIWETKEAGVGISLAVMLILANIITIKISVWRKR